MKAKATLLVICLSVMAGAVPLLAHHSFAAEYDANKPISITARSRKWNG